MVLNFQITRGIWFSKTKPHLGRWPTALHFLQALIMGECLSTCFPENDQFENETRGPLLRRRDLLDFNEYENVQDVEGAPTDKKWYHGKISNDEADFRLRMGAGGTDGSYLVYDNPRRRGQYILLVYHDRQLLRWKITRRTRDGKYILGEDGPGVVGYSSVRELIKAHRGITGKPIKMQNGGVLTLSKAYVYEVNA